jgi:4-azaleucine resistance transporter AzlC
MVADTERIVAPPTAFSDGVKAAAPIVLGYLPIGFAFGVLARTSGLTVAEAGLMSIFVYAGSSQFIGAGLIAAGASPATIFSTTFLVNLRHLLMSTALVPSLGHNPPWQNCLLAYGITDECFAVSTSILQGRPASPAFVAGLHITAQATWVLTSIAGALVGQAAARTEALGLDFALAAMFIGLLVPHFTGEGRRPRLVSGAVAAALAVAFSLLFPASSWSVILATLIGATVGVMMR